MNKSEITSEASSWICLVTRLIAFAKLAAVVWKWGRDWIARSTSEPMTIEEAAAYAGVRSPIYIGAPTDDGHSCNDDGRVMDHVADQIVNLKR